MTQSLVIWFLLLSPKATCITEEHDKNVVIVMDRKTLKTHEERLANTKELEPVSLSAITTSENDPPVINDETRKCYTVQVSHMSLPSKALGDLVTEKLPAQSGAAQAATATKKTTATKSK